MRYKYIDILRGLCIFLMIFFHLNYMLIHIFGIDTLNFSELFWYILGKVSALGFMGLSGVSFFLAQEKYGTLVRIKYQKYGLKIALLAALITFFTFIFIPEQLIVFGILHLFAISFLVLPYLARALYSSLILAFLVTIIWSYFSSILVSSMLLFPLGLRSAGFHSADYYPLFPYFWVILFWYSLATFLRRNNLLRLFQGREKQNLLENFLEYMWKKSLFIYIAHTPVLYILCYIFLYFSGFFIDSGSYF